MSFFSIIDYSDDNYCTEAHLIKTRCFFLFGVKIFTIKYYEDEENRRAKKIDVKNT